MIVLETVSRETVLKTDGEGMKSRGGGSSWRSSAAKVDLLLLFLDNQESRDLQLQEAPAPLLFSAPEIKLRANEELASLPEASVHFSESFSVKLLPPRSVVVVVGGGVPQRKGRPGTAGKETDERFLFLLRRTGEPFITGKTRRGDPDRAGHRSRVSSRSILSISYSGSDVQDRPPSITLSIHSSLLLSSSPPPPPSISRRRRRGVLTRARRRASTYITAVRGRGVALICFIIMEKKEKGRRFLSSETLVSDRVSIERLR